MDNKKLLIILAGLVLVWLVVRFLGGNKNRSFDPVLAQLDSNQITTILLYPAEGNKDEIKLTRTGPQWMATSGQITTPVVENSVKGILDYLSYLEADRIVSKNEQKWTDYEVDEEKGTRVKVMAGDRVLIELIIGRFAFDQMSRSATSFVRLVGKPDVYALDGFVSMTFNRSFDSFRDKSILRLDNDQVVSLEFSAGNITKHVLQKNAGNWVLDSQQKMDSATVANYLNGISYLTGNTFADDYQPATPPDYQLKIASNQQISPIELSCYLSPDSLNPIILHSTSNPGSYFRGDSTSLFIPVFNHWLEWTK